MRPRTAAARDGQQQVQALAAQAAEDRRGRQVGDVAGDGAEVAQVVGQALQLEGDAAEGLRPWRFAAPRQGLQRAAVGACVADHRVAGDRLGDQHGARRRDGFEQALDAAVLVAEHDLEQQDVLAVGLEPEVPRLDDPGMHRADGHLVHLVARDAREGIALRVQHHGGAAGAAVVGEVPAQRLQPRMALGEDGALLGDLALEVPGLRADRGERRIALADPRAGRAELPEGVLRQDGDQPRRFATVGEAEERRQPPVAADRRRDGVAKGLDRLERHGLPCHRAPVAQLQLVEPARRARGAHGALPPRAAAARASTARSGPGM